MTTEQNGHGEEPLEIDVDGVMRCVHNLANIYLRTGNHEVRTAIAEIAKGFCHIIGVEHKTFFPDPPPIRDMQSQGGITIPVPGAGPGWPGHAIAPGLQVPGMAPSPYAGQVAVNPQGDWAPDPGNPTGSKMVVVDPGPGASGAPAIPPGWVIAHPSQVPPGTPMAPSPQYPGFVLVPAQNVPNPNPVLTDMVWRKVASGSPEPILPTITTPTPERTP